MSQKIKVIFITTLVIGFFLVVVSPIMAEGWPAEPLIPKDCTRTPQGECGLTQIFQTIVNFSKLLLALTGSVALAMFMFGGILFIIASGNQEKISQGKEAMKTATIGIIIILGAWLIVNFTIYALTQGDVGNVKIFGNPWAEEQTIPKSESTSSNPEPVDVGARSLLAPY